jgi:sarcosine oxidase subunit alpha
MQAMMDAPPDPPSSAGRPSAAARALAAGEPALTRSFRLHRPRGAFCHAGWCQQCRVTLPDGRIALACRTEERTASPRLGWRRRLGRFAERLPPWFYEQRLLSPRWMRQVYLERLRRLSAAPALPPAAVSISGTWRERHCDVLVVGGGLAGLGAACDLAAAGRDLLLVEAEESFGGRARFQPHRAAELESMERRAVRLPHVLGTLCAGLYENARQALLIGPDGPAVLTFEELVVATGAYDRLPGFAGNDLPGIVGLRGFERLAALGAIPAGWRVGVFADAAGATDALATRRQPAWIAGPGDLPETKLPRYPRTQLRSAQGSDAVAAVELGSVGVLPCDLLVLGFSQPSYELQMQAGLRAVLSGTPPLVLTEGEALIPLRAVGEAAWRPPAATVAVTLASPDSFLCLCEDVRRRDVLAAIHDGFADVELLKRRTGAGTGPCQGKLCHGEMLACLAEAERPVALPTVRPLLRPVSLAALAAAEASPVEAGS